MDTKTVPLGPSSVPLATMFEQTRSTQSILRTQVPWAPLQMGLLLQHKPSLLGPQEDVPLGPRADKI